MVSSECRRHSIAQERWVCPLPWLSGPRPWQEPACRPPDEVSSLVHRAPALELSPSAPAATWPQVPTATRGDPLGRTPVTRHRTEVDWHRCSKPQALGGLSRCPARGERAAGTRFGPLWFSLICPEAAGSCHPLEAQGGPPGPARARFPVGASGCDPQGPADALGAGRSWPALALALSLVRLLAQSPELWRNVCSPSLGPASGAPPPPYPHPLGHRESTGVELTLRAWLPGFRSQAPRPRNSLPFPEPRPPLLESRRDHIPPFTTSRGSK